HKTRFVRRIDEFCHVYCRLLSHSAKCDEVLRRKGKNGTSGDRTFCPFHVVERRLIRRRQLHETEEAVECSARLRKPSRAQKLNRAVEISPCFSWRLGRYPPHFLEVAHGAVSFTAPRKHIHPLQSHCQIRWCP